MKKVIVRIASIILVIAMVITGFCSLNYILIDNTSSYTRLMMHEFYNQDNIDILCLGASHCYRGIIPSIVSEETGKNVFNASSSSQAPDASYAIIKEAIRMYDVEEVYLEISASMAQAVGRYKDRTNNPTSTYAISDYMRPSLNKVEFLLGATNSEQYINSFVPARRNWGSLLDTQYLRSIREKKSSNIYKNYEYESAKSEHEWYDGKGYVPCDYSIEDHMYYTTDGYDPVNVENISDDWKKSIDRIIDYCNHHNVKLTLYDAPISNFQLMAQGNYDEYIKFIKDFIEGKDVDYVEFNLLSNEYWDYQQTYYMDGHHLNMYGAEAFSFLLSKYIQGTVPEEAYCNSVFDKINTAPRDYYGITYSDDSEKNERTIRLISNYFGTHEFRIEIIKDDGTITLLQDFGDNNEITFSKDLIISNDDNKCHLVITIRSLLEDEGELQFIYE